MKRSFIFFIFIVFLSLMHSVDVFGFSAASVSDDKGIQIDGAFDDWNDKPYIEDAKHDIKSTSNDLEKIKYLADENYLYLYVERQSARKSEPWHFNVVFLNGARGDKHKVFPFNVDEPVYAPMFDVTLSYDDRKNSDGGLVNVGIDGEDIESTYSAADNGKAIEFRLPLNLVGLNGISKQVSFALCSDIDEREGVRDWVPDNRPVIVTAGPTFWQLSSLVFFIVISAAVYGICKNGEHSRRKHE